MSEKSSRDGPSDKYVVLRVDKTEVRPTAERQHGEAVLINEPSSLRPTGAALDATLKGGHVVHKMVDQLPSKNISKGEICTKDSENLPLADI